MIERVVSPAVPEPPAGSFSQCLVAGSTIYVSGQTGSTQPGGGSHESTVAGQARIAFERVRALVEAAGASMRDVVKLTIFVTDMGSRAEVAAVRRAFFTGTFPCSTLVQVAALAHPDLLVEIEATAVRPA